MMSPNAADMSYDSFGRKPAVNSSVATFRKNGELFAITHQHAATGYKSQPIQGVRFEGVSTYKASYQDRGSNPNAKVLTAYSATAPRNTMPVVFENSNKVKQRNSGNAGAANNSNNTKNNPLAAGQTNESTRFATTHKKAFVHHNGKYPSSMRQLVGERLPKFSAHQSAMVKGSFDFLGLNYYTSLYASDVSTPPNSMNTSYTLDSQANLTAERNGMLIGPVAGSSWLYVYPRGIGELLKYIKHTYDNPLIFITENGIDEKNDDTWSLAQALNDTWRIDYHSKHLSFVQQAIRAGSNIHGYFAWSLLDNFEWINGYTVRFGLHYIDYKNNLKRYPKASVYWFKIFLK